MITHPESERIQRALERCFSRAIRWSGTLYRSSSPRYANGQDLVAGIGSKVSGARWNPPGSFAAVYASLDPHTALDEVLAHYRYYQVPVESAMPRVMVSIRVRLSKVLDLTDGTTRSILRVSDRRMIEEPWRDKQASGVEAVTQAIGRLAFDLGWEALLVPSAARKNGVNLILFPDNISAMSIVQIINANELPNRN